MKTAYLIQHCQSQQHINRQARLWPDERNGLTDLGQKQAWMVASHMREKVMGQACRIYSSCMQRAFETAQIVGDKLGISPEKVPGLHEYNGRFAMERTGDGLERQVAMSNWSLFDWRPFPGAETWREFQDRVSETMNQLTKQHEQYECEQGQESIPILVVHGGTLSSIVVWWLGIPLDVLPDRTCFAASPGSLSILRRNEHGKPVI